MMEQGVNGETLDGVLKVWVLEGVGTGAGTAFKTIGGLILLFIIYYILLFLFDLNPA
ncbi:MAG: hypothetical protein HOD92_01635 [Deltaproteobacteria bacterium]|jgi:hypothetical protein|nr:hypothetical protein [Deltaproteobacteria bacterium]MBT4526288.1 hypothetical protein [Deltaproteobacteria bacterium]